MEFRQGSTVFLSHRQKNRGRNGSTNQHRMPTISKILRFRCGSICYSRQFSDRFLAIDRYIVGVCSPLERRCLARNSAWTTNSRTKPSVDRNEIVSLFSLIVAPVAHIIYYDVTRGQLRRIEDRQEHCETYFQPSTLKFKCRFRSRCVHGRRSPSPHLQSKYGRVEVEPRTI